MPLGNASPSATFRADPSGPTIATIPVASGCPNGCPPLTYALPRPSTTSSFPAAGTESSRRSPCVTSDPSGSLRRIRPSPPETTSRRPSGSQSTQHGNDGALRMTSLFPLRSTAITSCVPQSENHSLPSCQRGCSPNRMPVIKVLTNQPSFITGRQAVIQNDQPFLILAVGSALMIAVLCRSCNRFPNDDRPGREDPRAMLVIGDPLYSAVYAHFDPN